MSLLQHLFRPLPCVNKKILNTLYTDPLLERGNSTCNKCLFRCKL